MKQREIPLFSALKAPCDASEKTLKGCDNEQDAIAVSIVLSRLSQAEIARRMGISAPMLTMLKKGQRTLTTALLQAFCNATGCNLVRQYRALQSLLRQVQGRPRETDRIAQIASYSEAA